MTKTPEPPSRDRWLDERFAAHLDGCLPPRDQQRLAAELRVNKQLQRDLDEYERTVAIVRQALREPEAAGVRAARTERLLAAATAPAPLAPARWSRSPRTVLLAVLAAAAVLSLLFWLDSTWPATVARQDFAAGDAPPAGSAAGDSAAVAEELAELGAEFRERKQAATSSETAAAGSSLASGWEGAMPTAPAAKPDQAGDPPAGVAATGVAATGELQLAEGAAVTSAGEAKSRGRAGAVADDRRAEPGASDNRASSAAGAAAPLAGAPSPRLARRLGQEENAGATVPSASAPEGGLIPPPGAAAAGGELAGETRRRGGAARSREPLASGDEAANAANAATLPIPSLEFLVPAKLGPAAGQSERDWLLSVFGLVAAAEPSAAQAGRLERQAAAPGERMPGELLLQQVALRLPQQAAEPAESIWLLEGSQAEVQRSLQQLARFAASEGFVLRAGEVAAAAVVAKSEQPPSQPVALRGGPAAPRSDGAGRGATEPAATGPAAGGPATRGPAARGSASRSPAVPPEKPGRPAAVEEGRRPTGETSQTPVTVDSAGGTTGAGDQQQAKPVPVRVLLRWRRQS